MRVFSITFGFFLKGPYLFHKSTKIFMDEMMSISLKQFKCGVYIK